MALPTTITTDGLATQGCAGPFKSSGGNIYTVIVNDTQFNLRALKATDPTTSFAGVGTDVVIGAGGDFIHAIAGYQVADVIHIVSKNSNGSDPVDIRYHTFNMATDLWVVTNEMVKTNMALATGGVGWRCAIGIVVRSDGSVVICYNGPTETVATVVYDRVYYARRVAGVWTADVAIGTAGVASSWVGGHIVLGALDRCHFIFSNYTGANLQHRTMNSAYALEPLPAAPLDAAVEDGETSYAQRGAMITNGSIVCLPYYDVTQDINHGQFTSEDVPVPVIVSNINQARDVLAAPQRYCMSFAIDNVTIWNVFIDSANDLYTQSNVNGAGWSTPAGFLTTSASAIYTNVYTRGSALVLGMIFHDTDPKYHEYTLSVIGAATTTIIGGLSLIGVGR